MSQPLPVASFTKAALGCTSLAILFHFVSAQPWSLAIRDIFGHIAFSHGLCALLWKWTSFGAPAQSFVDSGTPSLPQIAKYLPGITMLQVVLGAAYRHGFTGFAPHLTGAILVSAVLLYVATGVFTPAPAGHRARQASFWLLWITIAQIGFGLGAYYYKMNSVSSGITHAHILFGALTLTFVILLSAYLRRDVETAAAGYPGSARGPASR
jgi:hypothetical protein